MVPPGIRLIRVMLVTIGAGLLLVGTADMLTRRARYVDSSPRPGTVLDSTPEAVTVRFNRGLDPRSTISVVSTVSILPSGEVLYTGGTDVQTASGLNPEAPGRTSLRATLQPGLPGGLYRVDWLTVEARGKAESVGSFYFGVGMPVPAHITREGRESFREWDNYRNREWREGGGTALLGGVFLIVMAWLLPLFPGSDDRKERSRRNRDLFRR